MGAAVGTVKAGGTDIVSTAQEALEPDAVGGDKSMSEALPAPATLSPEDELLLSSYLNDLEQARHYALTAFQLFDELTDEKAKDERKRIRQELKNLRNAIHSISDEAFIDLIHAENVGDFAETHQLMLKQIDAAIQKNSRTAGNSQTLKLHRAAGYLLEHFRRVHGSPTASVFEGAGGDGVRFSPAIEFLNNEFQRLAGDTEDRRQLAITTIRSWLKSRPKSSSISTK